MGVSLLIFEPYLADVCPHACSNLYSATAVVDPRPEASWFRLSSKRMREAKQSELSSL